MARKGRERVDDAIDEARTAYNEETGGSTGSTRPY
jgi:hypothetical protein